MLWASEPIRFATAWQNTGAFWAQTLLAVARHPLAVLGCSVVPAAERAYFLLESKPIERWRLTALEAVLTVWRVLLFVVAVWVALSPEEWQALKQHFTNPDELQLSLQHTGAYLGRDLHVLLLELLFFAAAFLLLNFILVLIVRGLAKISAALQSPIRQKALVSVLRNLLLVPLGLIYLVEIFRLRFS
jgi:hypothetical protein